MNGLSVNDINGHQPACQFHHGLNGIGKTLCDSITNRQTVHNHIDTVLDVLVQLDLFGKLVETAVNTDSYVSALAGTLKNLGVFSLSSADNRSQQLDLGPLRQLHNLIHHLVNGLLANLSSALGTVGDTDSGIKKPHIIINFRNGTDCGTRVPVGRLLVNGNGR